MNDDQPSDDIFTDQKTGVLLKYNVFFLILWLLFSPVWYFIFNVDIVDVYFLSPVMTISENGGTYTIVTKTTAKTTEVKFR